MARKGGHKATQQSQRSRGSFDSFVREHNAQRKVNELAEKLKLRKDAYYDDGYTHTNPGASYEIENLERQLQDARRELKAAKRC